MSTGNRMYVYMKLKEHLKCRGVLLAYREGRLLTFEYKSIRGALFTREFDLNPKKCNITIEDSSM